MKEETLARFFEGRVTAADLANDLRDSETQVSEIRSTVEIKDMQEEFVVTRDMALTLCDAVLREELAPGCLAIVGFALIASDKFSWDGDDVVGDVIADWASPEIYYELTIANVERFRAWLRGAEEYPARRRSVARQLLRVVSVRSKRSSD